MADWNPDLYRQFEDERTRPARDLLARVACEEARHVIDLGCGPGNSTELLVARFPEAQVLGLDHSEAMLASARNRLPGVSFIKADIASWTAETPVDLIFANAALQWVPGHDRLLPRLFAMLAPGGVLAFQVPDNANEPSHRLMREIAADGPWSGPLALAGAAGSKSVLPPQGYFDRLAPLALDVDVWRTTYFHPMGSPARIVDWLRSTGLKPYIDPLAPADRAAFLARYEAAIDEAYPQRANGQRLLAFPRLFVVARRA